MTPYNVNPERFWEFLDRLLESARVVIDRPAGSAHPRYPKVVYPLDYGYLAGTTGGDGRELDLWRGSLPEPVLDAVVCTVDLVKHDAEVKLLLGCNGEEKRVVMAFHNNSEFMAAMLLERLWGREGSG